MLPKLIAKTVSNSLTRSAIRKTFCEEIRVQDGMGFTETSIFVPPHLVRSTNIVGDEIVSGVAVLSFNKKKETWGWKAISAALEVGE